MPNERSEPLYVISIAARMVGVHAQTLRYYERAGLIAPARSQGRLRLYSQWDIERLKLMKSLMEDLGVNLAGVEVIIRLTEHIARMEGRLKALEQELQRLQGGEGER
jgi:MerR family transcriptional regulator/heat shock protein HspR